MLGEVVDRECVGGISCASARASRVDFQACSIDHSDISPFRINELRTALNSVAQNPPSRTSDLACRMMPSGYGDARKSSRANCVRPSNVSRSLTAFCKSLGILYSDERLFWRYRFILLQF